MASTLKSNAEKKAIKALHSTYCEGLDLKTVKENVARTLNHIGDNGMFAEYTMHDISHVDGVLALLDKIIPPETAAIMTNADWLMIVLAVYFHDFGMYISAKEYDEREANEEFLRYKHEKESIETLKADLARLPQDKRERFLFQEYVRHNHGNRIYEWIVNCGTRTDEPYKLIYDMLKPLSSHFRKSLAEVCQSHLLEELPESLQSIDESYGSEAQDKVNLLYISVLLRSADLLHITSDRTPNVEYRLISPQNKVSVREWLKQKAIRSIDVKKERDKNGVVLTEQNPHVFEIQAEFSSSECYFSFVEFIQYATDELKRCHHWCEVSENQNKNGYYFPWDEIDIQRVVTSGFKKEKLHFDIDHNSILSLLTGHMLYNDSTVVLRELIQNALDAGKAQDALSKEGSDYHCQIDVKWNSESRNLSISDNGTGMTEQDIKDYLLRVGASKYQSEAFKKAYPNFHSISRFGIGLLTCFMISDDVDIYTLSSKDTRCLHLLIRKLNGEYLMRNDADVSNINGGRHGTTIILKVRPEIDMANIESQIKYWIILPYGEVNLYVDQNPPVRIGYKNTEEALNAYISTLENVKAEKENFKVSTVKDSQLGLTMSCLQRRNPYTNIWSIWYGSDRDRKKSFVSGVCVEGIRVTNNVPGSEGNEAVILINCEGNLAPRTNVARNDIEAGEALDKLYQVVYSHYMEMYTEQAQTLQHGNSSIWAFKEINYCLDMFCVRLRRASTLKWDVLQKTLSEVKCGILDNGKQIEVKSLNEFPNELFTIDSVSYVSSMNLLQDIQNSSKTPIALLEELTGDRFEEKPVLAENNLSSYLIGSFHMMYEPKMIVINRALRSIKICWKKGLSLWQQMKPVLHSYRYTFHNTMTLFILKDNNGFTLQDEGDCKIICSANRIFLLQGTPIYDFIVKKVLIDGNDKEKVEILCGVIAEFLRNKSIDGDEVSRFFENEQLALDADSKIVIRKQDFFKALQDSADSILNFKYYYHM